MMLIRRAAVALMILLTTIPMSSQTEQGDNAVVRTTLGNGLRVVIIRDPLAPVVTVEENYLVGADETPAGFPGMAHAQEHMAFRGCAGVSADQTAAIFAQLGGYGNADTQQNITQYFTTVPAADLEVALRLDAACMQDVDDSEAEWAQEKGAIEQEVARDLSEPTYKFVTRLNEGHVLGHAVRTRRARHARVVRRRRRATCSRRSTRTGTRRTTRFSSSPATSIRRRRWRASRSCTDRSRAGRLPRDRRSHSRRSNTETFTLDSNLPYTLAFVAYRLPGTDSPDFAAARVLADVLASQRGNICTRSCRRARRSRRNSSWRKRIRRRAWALPSPRCRRAPIRPPSSRA